MPHYSFDFKGGLRKAGGVTSKFYLFVVAPLEGAEEVIFFEAKKKGLITDNALLQVIAGDKENAAFDYSISTPHLKIFTLLEGFGLTGTHHYFSFYFRLSHEGRIVTIKPLASASVSSFSKENSMLFKGRGQFLSQEEVKSLLGEKSVSYGFYRRQCPLPKTVLNALVSTELDKNSLPPGTKEIRRVRL